MPGRPLEVGLFVPHWSGGAGRAPGWPEVQALARHAEAVGFDSLWVADTVLVKPGKADPMGFWECWSLLGALSQVTTRVALGSLVTGSFRNPVLLANQANTVDELSGGRLILGMGAGEVEQHRHVGLDPERRYGRLAEVLAITAGLLRDGRVTLEGRHHAVQDVQLPLRGPTAGGPPIMIGSYPAPGPRMRRLVAERADGWNGWLAFDTCSLDVVRAAGAALDEACAAAGRDPASLWRSVAVGVALGERPLRFGPWDATRAALQGPAERVADALREYADAGISHVQVYLGAEPDLDAFADVLARLDG